MRETGLFVVLEGIDNCGKTTQSQMLREYLEQKDLVVVQTREPGGTEDGEAIRKLLLERNKMLDPITQTLLFYAARRQFVTEIVKPHLLNGVSVISDRFEASTFVYQGLTQGVHGDLLDALSRHVVREADCRPDLYVILDVTAEESFKRGQNLDNAGQNLIYEKQGLEFMEKIRKGYLQYAEGIPTFFDMTATQYSGYNATVINGMRDKSEIHREITQLVDQQVERRTLQRREGGGGRRKEDE